MIVKTLLSLAVLGFAASMMVFGTSAVFTDVATNPGNTFATGNVDINTSLASDFITFSDMAPGDKVTQPLTVSNAGSLDLRYAVTSTTTEDTLAAQLDLTVKSDVTTCTNAGFGVDGTSLYGADDLGSVAGTAIFGNPAQGPHIDDKTLVGLASEVLCFQVELPLATNNTYQGLTTTATFTFDAEQTKNN